MDPTAEQLRAFVGPRADYYLIRWARIDAGEGRASSINWPAFLLGGFWLLYRKMYRYFWIFVGVLVAVTAVEQFILWWLNVREAPSALDLLVTLSIAVTYGTFGTYLYQLHVQRRIRALALAGEPAQEQLRRAGGTSLLGPLVFFVFTLAMTFFGLLAQGLGQ